MERLTRALFSFYREDPQQARRLDPLLACRLSRGWWCLRIECRDPGCPTHLRPEIHVIAISGV
ncbi:MAG: hypothetical protein ACO23M_12090 [Vulcanococcus sp.]